MVNFRAGISEEAEPLGSTGYLTDFETEIDSLTCAPTDGRMGGCSTLLICCL